MHSLVSILVHVVFATKERRKLITPELESRLWSYLGGLARGNRMRALKVGGVSDHLHLLISLPASLSIGRGVQLLKGHSSKWVSSNFPSHGMFEWQKGYAAFSVSEASVESTIAYIENQAEHHRQLSFKEELEAILAEQAMPHEDWMLDDFFGP